MSIVDFKKVKKQTTTNIKNLCTPAFVYLAISIVSIFIMLMQNFGNTTTYCLGQYSCNVQSTISVFVIKILYIAFWTWLLNYICKSGYTNVAWFLVLLPYILLFVAMIFLLIKLK